jgi:hypothetical protein
MKKFLSLTIALTLVLAAGCSKEQPKPAGGTETKNTEITVIKYPNTPWYDSVYIADAKGYFAEQGI